MNSLIIIFVAVGALGILVWLIVAAMRDSKTGSSNGSSPTDLGDGTSHSHDSGDSGGGDGGGGGGD